jgi:disulfide bond formation protein DsbB
VSVTALVDGYPVAVFHGDGCAGLANATATPSRKRSRWPAARRSCQRPARGVRFLGRVVTVMLALIALAVAAWFGLVANRPQRRRGRDDLHAVLLGSGPLVVRISVTLSRSAHP